MLKVHVNRHCILRIAGELHVICLDLILVFLSAIFVDFFFGDEKRSVGGF